MEYKDLLFDPDISWDRVTQCFPPPAKLYKYQSFVTQEKRENPYWMVNMCGQFHTSQVRDFEDKLDCSPSFNQKRVTEYIDGLLKAAHTTEIKRRNVLLSVERAINPDYLSRVEKNYQKDIQIGCFTDSADNEAMWDKYSCDKTGFCIEYATQKNRLLRSSTLPVVYENDPYDSSLMLASMIILCSIKAGLLDPMLTEYETEYARLLKTTYIPLFIKKPSWAFEREYRMFLLKHRSTREGMLTNQDYLDSNGNIDLSDAVTAIYLGQNFENNQNAPQLRAQIISICKEKNISLYKKELQNGNTINKRLLSRR